MTSEIQKHLDRNEARIKRLEDMYAKMGAMKLIFVGYSENDLGRSEPIIAFLTEAEAKDWAKLLGNYTYKVVPLGEKNL